MKLFFDLFPVAVFFLVFKLYGIFAATAVAIAASFAQVGFHWLRHRRFETLHLVTLALIAVLGGATLVFHDDTFIKWKPSVVNWVFAGLFLGSRLWTGKTLVERLMGQAVKLPAEVWERLNIGWAAFFLAVGLANLYVAYHFDTDTWVNFKLFGIMGLTLVFAVAQAFYLARYISADQGSGEET
jgi:intracellular septation protein